MSVDIDYPEKLPTPEQQGYAIQHVSPLTRVDMQSGRARQRRRFTSVPSMVQVSWLMTNVEAQLFEGWFRWIISDGAEWFNGPLKTPMGIKHYVCRFVDIYAGPQAVSPKYWRFTAQLEIRERQTVGEDLIQFPDFITYADIIDLAVNREWPKA